MSSDRQPRILLFLSFLAFLPFVGTVASAQQQYGGISGEIHVARGDFPGRVLVELRLRGAAIASVYSDEQGKFGFTGLEANPYHVVIVDDRFYPVDQLVVVDRPDKNRSEEHTSELQSLTNLVCRLLLEKKKKKKHL